MVLKPDRFLFIDPKDAEGTIWADLNTLGDREEADTRLQSHIVDLVSEGNISLAAGASLDEKLTAPFQVMEFMVDFPKDVTGEVWIDGKKRFTTNDELGLGGSFHLGDGSTVYMPINEVRIKATNNAAVARDVRAWMVVV